MRSLTRILCRACDFRFVTLKLSVALRFWLNYLLQYKIAKILITLHVGTLEDLFPEVSRLDPAANVIGVGRGLPNLNLYLSLGLLFLLLSFVLL